jgi:lipoprotein-releasing system ATP-binding protein
LRVTLRNVSKTFKNLEVISNLSIEFSSGKTVSIMGQSGVGKSTLLQLLGLLDSPSQGEILFDGRSITGVKERAQYRGKNIGFIFQSHNLLPEFSSAENVAMPLLIAGVDPNLALSNAEKILKRVGVRPDASTPQLSGGEQQRVSLARALVNAPKLVLADEPTGNLDSENADRVMLLLREVCSEYGALLIMVTHNPDLAKQCDQQFEMKFGGELREK